MKPPLCPQSEPGGHHPGRGTYGRCSRHARAQSVPITQGGCTAATAADRAEIPDGRTLPGAPSRTESEPRAGTRALLPGLSPPGARTVPRSRTAAPRAHGHAMCGVRRCCAGAPLSPSLPAARTCRGWAGGGSRAHLGAGGDRDRDRRARPLRRKLLPELRRRRRWRLGGEGPSRGEGPRGEASSRRPAPPAGTEGGGGGAARCPLPVFRPAQAKAPGSCERPRMSPPAVPVLSPPLRSVPVLSGGDGRESTGPVREGCGRARLCRVGSDPGAAGPPVPRAAPRLRLPGDAVSAPASGGEGSPQVPGAGGS